MTWTVKTKNGMSVMKYLHILALGIVALAVSVPLMTNYCIDGVNVSFYLRRLQKICPEDIFLLLPSLLVRAGAPVEFVYKLLLFGLNVATAGISYLCFYGIFRDRLTGVMGSMQLHFVFCPSFFTDCIKSAGRRQIPGNTGGSGLCWRLDIP